MWIYYSCSHGPGHQTHEEDFKYFTDLATMGEIKDSLHRMFDHYECLDLIFWEVKKIAADSLSYEIKNSKSRIQYLRRYLKMLKAKEGFCPDEKEGKDPVIQRNLKGKIEIDILERLHKAGLMYMNSDICNWEYGKKYPTGPQRSKILRIIRRSKSYR